MQSSDSTPSRLIRITIADQLLELIRPDHTTWAFPVSTSAYGLGTEEGSLRTPLGKFRIAQKIGHGAPVGTIFRGRQPTGEIGTEEMEGDVVQTRILWLDGLEPANANTHERYIYIHGTNQESRIGTPASHGCVRMGNRDIIELFDHVEEGDPVVIRE